MGRYLIRDAKALEQGSAEAFHAAFGASDPMLTQAKQQTKHAARTDKNIERMRQLAEKNVIAGLGF